MCDCGSRLNSPCHWKRPKQSCKITEMHTQQPSILTLLASRLSSLDPPAPEFLRGTVGRYIGLQGTSSDVVNHATLHPQPSEEGLDWRLGPVLLLYSTPRTTGAPQLKIFKHEASTKELSSQNLPGNPAACYFELLCQCLHCQLV